MIFYQIYYTIDMMFNQIYYKMKLEIGNYIFYIGARIMFCIEKACFFSYILALGLHFI